MFGGDKGLYERISALDNLRFFADVYRVPARLKQGRIDELLESVGLKGRENERVRSRGIEDAACVRRSATAKTTNFFWPCHRR